MSGPIHGEIVQHPSAWYGKDLVNDPSWLVSLAPRDLAEIGAAVRDVKAHGLALGEVGRNNFPLPTFGPKLARYLDEIRTGRGFVVLRGLNAEDYSEEDAGLIFRAIGSRLGIPVTQNPARRLARARLRPWPQLRRHRRARLRDQRAFAVPYRQLRPGGIAVPAPGAAGRPEQYREFGHAA